MATVNQPSARPTNKLTAVVVVGAAMGFIEPLWAEYVPMFADERIYALIQWGVAGIVGWFIKDAPNV